MAKQSVREAKVKKSVYVLNQGKRTPKFIKVAQVLDESLLELLVKALEEKGLEVYISGDDQE